jgi:hypothetical protein
MRIQSGKINTGVKLAMKKALALGAFALVMALPLVSSAATIVSNFSSSSTGTSAIAVGDTIQFEVVLTVDVGADISTLFFSVSGDVATAFAQAPVPFNDSWPGVANNVTNWEWHYKTGAKVKFDTTGTITPAGIGRPGSLGTAVSGSYGFFGSGVGTLGKGVGSLLGTVTVTASADGVFEGGGFMLTSLDGIFTNPLGEELAGSTVTTASFTVVPEPGTAVLMLLGLGGLGVMGRKNR